MYQYAGHGAVLRLLGLPGGHGSPERLVLSGVCAPAHSIRLSLPQRCHSRMTARETDACPFPLRSQLERETGQSLVLQSWFSEGSPRPNCGAGYALEPEPQCWSAAHEAGRPSGAPCSSFPAFLGIVHAQTSSWSRVRSTAVARTHS